MNLKSVPLKTALTGKYACWVKNNRKAWYYWKRRNRKLYRKMLKEDLRKECLEIDSDI